MISFSNIFIMISFANIIDIMMYFANIIIMIYFANIIIIITMMHTRSIHFKYEAIHFHTKIETASEVSSSQTELVIQRKGEDKLKIAWFVRVYKENQVKDFACSFSKLTDQLSQVKKNTRQIENWTFWNQISSKLPGGWSSPKRCSFPKTMFSTAMTTAWQLTNQCSNHTW